MPVHDWTRVDAGIFHHFHVVWIGDPAWEGLVPGRPEHNWRTDRLPERVELAWRQNRPELAVQDQVKILYNFFGETWDSSFHGAVFEKPEDELLYLKNHAFADNPADFWLYLMAVIHDGRLLVGQRATAVERWMTGWQRRSDSTSVR